MGRDIPLVSLLTARGRGAVATIAYRGDVTRIDAAGVFRAANGRPFAGQPLDRIVFGYWGEEPAEEVVVCRVAEDRLEVHCHGGEAAAGRILSQLEGIGAERIEWRKYVERVEGTFAADVAEALAAATTPRTAAIIARQAEGPLREALRQLSKADPALDRAEILTRIDGLLSWAGFGLHLTRPWRVVLYGEPNVGKSSLINALIGFERAIVFDQPGTTRDVVTAETAFDGWPVRLSDTAGIRTGAGELEAAGIERAKAVAAEADLRILVEDRSRPSTKGTTASSEEARLLKPSLIVLNKSDLPDARHENPLPGFIEVSARTGQGIRELMARITQILVPQVPVKDEAVPISERQIDSLRSAKAALLAGDDEEYRRAIGAIGF